MMYIIILCNNWQDSCDTFDVFMDYLDCYSPDSILQCYESSNMVDTMEYVENVGEEIFRYVFVDYHYKNWFDEVDDARIIDSDGFFNGILEYYQWEL